MIVICYTFWMYSKKCRECEKIVKHNTETEARCTLAHSRHQMLSSKAADVVFDFVEKRDMSLNVGQLNGLIISALEEDK